MPGSYAHITLLHELLQPDRLKKIFPSSSGFPAILMRYHQYCTLGSVSPDYPNLEREDGSALLWADAMHCTRACEMIASGIVRVRKATGTTRDKILGWLLGYCAHLATDVTIHPVVQARVGEYVANQRQHRICEMHQDSYIYHRMNLGEIGDSDTFAQTVTLCGNVSGITGLDRDIITLWEGMLKDVHPGLFSTHQPNILSWHNEFVARVDDCSKSTEGLFPLATVIAGKMDLTYPSFATVDFQFIEGQLIPSDRPSHLHYDEIFDHAAHNAAMVWRFVVRAVCSDDTKNLFAFGDWNLDTGRDERGRLVFW